MMNDPDIAGDGIGDGIGDANSRGPDDAVVDPSLGDSSDSSSSSSSFSRTVRIFISSTFRDFQEERDLLVRRVFPELRRRARERGVEVVDVDLRWGITESQAERGETLSICLQEIDRCRPYFIGLLGERYGWQPAADRYPTALIEEQAWLREHLGGTSVTELEILHGVLNDPDMTGLAFFYLRDPAWSANRGADFASESEDAKARLGRLKDRLRESGFPVVDGYPSPQAVADRILEDLWQKIDARFPASEVPDEHEQERRLHESFARTRRTLYVGGDQAVSGLLGRLDAASDESDPAARRSRIAVVTGESGCGKSALLANAIARLRASRPQDLVFEHYLGSAADAGNADSIARRLCREVIRRERIARGEDPNAAGEDSGMGDRRRMQGLGGTAGLGESPGEGLGAGAENEEKVQRDGDGLAVDSQRLFEELPEYLARGAALATARGGRFVVVLDALDKLSSGTDAAWLPQWVPPGVRLVLSTLEGAPLQMARQREWPIETASRLTAQSARQLVVESLERFNKRLDDSLLDAIAAHPLATLPIFLRVLTDELRVFGSHEELASRLRGSLACATVEELYREVLVRIEGDLRREGGSAEDLGKVLTALWASRRGMSEAEVVEFAGVPRVTWSRISLALDESLFEQSGRWIFSHDYLRRAVAARYLSGDSQQREQHASLARWWDAKVREGLGAEIVDGEAAAATDADEAEGDTLFREPADDALVARAIDELPWQWAQAARWDDLAACLLDPLAGPEIVMRIDDQQIFRWWQTLGEHRGLKAEVEHERVWEGWRVRSWREVDRLAGRLSGTLAYAGLASAFQRRLMEAVVAVRRRRATRLGTPQSQRDLSVSLDRVGGLALQEGDHGGARAAFEESLAIARDLHERLGTPRSQRDLNVSLDRVGDLTLQEGDRAGARAAFEESLGIRRKLHERLGTPESQRDVSLSLVRLGDLALVEGDRAGARAAFEECLKNSRELHARLGTPESQRDLALSLNRLGGLALQEGDRAGARAAFEEFLKIARDLHERLGTPESQHGVSVSLNQLGDLALQEGDRAGARAAFEEMHAIARKLHDRLGTPGSWRDLSVSLGRLGDLALQEGDRAGARAAFEECLKNFRKLHDRLGTPESQRDVSVSLNRVGDLALQEGDRAGARGAFEEWLGITRELHDRLGTPESQRDLSASLGRLGRLAFEEGDRAGARAAFEESLGIRRKRHNRLGTTESQRDLGLSLQCLGDLALQEGDRAGARALFEASLGIDRELHNRLGTPESERDLSLSLQRLGDLALQEGDRAGARAAFGESLGICRELHDRLGTPDSQRNLSVSLSRLGRLAFEEGDRAGARAAFEESLCIRRKRHDRLETPESLRDLSVGLNEVGGLTLQEGDRAGARAAFEESLGIARDLAARFGTPGDLNGWVWSAQKCASVRMKQSCSADARATLAECRDAVEAISDVSEVSDVEIVDTAAAWWERWCEVHEAMGDQSTADDARTRAAALRNRIEAMKAASGDGGSGGVSEGD